MECGYDKQNPSGNYANFVEDDNPIPCGICARMLKNAGVVRVVNRRGEICL
jgi:hypothetical protein